MQILCPKCHFAREIPDDKVPANAKVATCPKCKIKFQFRELPDEDTGPAEAGPPPPSPAAAPVPPARATANAAGAPPLPGSRQQLAASRMALRPPTAPSDPGEGIWNRLEAMAPESVPPAFDPDASHRPQGPGTPPPGSPGAPGGPGGPGRPEAAGARADAPGFAKQAKPARLVKNPLEEAADDSAGDEPEFLRYTRAPSAGAPGAAEGFAQPSYLREHGGRTGRQGDVPWENMGAHGGFLGALIKTVKLTLFSPAEFFSQMPLGRGISKPLGFAMILGTFNALIGFVYEMLGLSFQPSELPSDAFGGLLVGMGAGMVVITPLMLALALCINAFLLTLALRAFKGASGGFEGTFRALAYGSAVGLCGIVPYVGSIVAGLWGIALTLISLKHVHRTSMGKVVLAMLLLVVATLCIILALALVLGMGAAMLEGAS